jgi:hypothetical protein
MNANHILIVHELLCAALFYSVFFRACRACEKVRTDVRLAFVALGLVACAGMAAPLVWGLVPDLFGLVLLAAMVIVQLVTSHHWTAGVPDRFYKPGCVPRRRRASDALQGMS